MPFPVGETHGIALLPQNRLLAHSEGLGWRDLYASFATERSWSASLPAIDHHCVAYCVNQANAITRRFEGDLRTQSAVLRARQVGTIPAGVGSHWQVGGSADVLLIYLHRSMLDRVAEEVLELDRSRIEIRPVLAEADALLEQLALSILASMRERNPRDRLYVETMAQMIAVQLLQGHSVKGARVAERAPSFGRPGLRRVVELIETALEEDLSLAVLADQAGMSPFYFARAFRKQFGEAPHQYVLRKRIERSKELLLRTDTSLVEIALETGFSSQSHFTSTFKRLVGITPGEYRRAI
ncbi:MAG: helix-turn-helix domain-containing protein [Sphingomonadales bacterium]